MEKILFKNRIALKILFIFYFAFFAFIPSMMADSYGLNTAADTAYGEGTSEGENGIVTSVPDAVGKVMGLVLQFVGAIFFILMIYGGFTWMLARGNEQQVQKAKDIIEASVIGIVIVLSAYAITAFIGNALTE